MNRYPGKETQFSRLENFAYIDGKEAFMEGKTLRANPKLSDDPLFTFWQCGWHDADIEAGNRITNFHPITKQEIAA
jgi:hypothetical protein